MLPAEILAQVRRIEILTGRLVSESLAGQYLSVFKGRGMEFAEVREYSAGDDVRAIDWNVTARTGRPHVRVYAEERELTVVIACDLSKSLSFGSSARLKNEVAAELSAVLAFSAMQNNDKVGLLLFTDKVETYVAPRKGRKHVLKVIRDVLAYEPKGSGTRLDSVLETVTRLLKRRCIVFLISDFRLQNPEEESPAFERALSLGSLKHDLIPVLISDPRESKLPQTGALIELTNAESGENVLFDASSTAVLAHAESEQKRLDALNRLFRVYGIDPIRISTDRPAIDPVVDFFRRRSRRMRR
jgi:uncharacterized protein (DUF58 family)